MNRRNFVSSAIALVNVPHALAQESAGVLTLVVPFSAGSEADVVSRVYAKFLAAAMKRPVVVANRPGAGGVLAAKSVLQGKQDGDTVLISSPAFIVAPHVNPAADYDPLRDFAVIGGLNSTSLVLMSPVGKADFGSIASLVAQARKSPGKVTYAGNGIGTFTHLVMESFANEAGIDLTYVPFKGLQEGSLALMGAQVDLAMEGRSGALSRIQTGRVRPIMVFDKDADPLLPGVPTPAQAGYPRTGHMSLATSGIVAPAKTPPRALQALRDASRSVVADPKFAEAIQKVGVRPYAPSLEDMSESMEQMSAQVASVVKGLERAGKKISVN